MSKEQQQTVQLLKTSPSWRRASPSSVPGTLGNKGNLDTQACIEGRPGRRPRKGAVISKPQWETQNRPSLSAHRQNQPWWHHGFGLFCSLELTDYEFLLCKPPSLWCFVMAALTNESTWLCNQLSRGGYTGAIDAPLPKNLLHFGNSSSIPHLLVFSFFSVMSDIYVWWGWALI